MPLSRRALITLALLTLLPAAIYTALSAGKGATAADAQSIPLLMSPNVELLTTRPGHRRDLGRLQPDGAVLLHLGPGHDHASSTSPTRRTRSSSASSSNAVFENEAMTMGERGCPTARSSASSSSATTSSQASPGDRPASTSAAPAARSSSSSTSPTRRTPKIVGRTPTRGAGAATTSTHTVACMNAACTIAYSAGDDGKFSIVDLSDLTKPQADQDASSRPPAQPNPIFTARRRPPLGGRRRGRGVAHRLGRHRGVRHLRPAQPAGAQRHRRQRHEDAVQRLHPPQLAAPERRGVPPGPARRAWSTATSPSSPRRTTPTTATRSSARRPARSRPGRSPTLDGGGYRAANPNLEPNKGTIRVLDTINAPAEAGGGLSTPVGGFCSAHWFDYHQSGVDRDRLLPAGPAPDQRARRRATSSR